MPPYPFGQQDLEATRLAEGVSETLRDFRSWRDGHPSVVAEHVNQYSAHVTAMGSRYSGWGDLKRYLVPGRKRRDSREQLAREINYFGVYDLAEVLPPLPIQRLVGGAFARAGPGRGLARSIDRSKGVEGVIASIQRQLPALQHVDEMKWLAGRLKRLHRILPEAVIQAGGMGKVCRTIAGVLAIGAFDTYDSGREVAREHLTRILPGAYAYGATYAIVDDTLHDLPGYLSPDDRERYHQMILRGLSQGVALDPSAFPDHPIAEELHDLYNLVLDSYPFAEYRHLYHAAEAMYLAQHRDASAEASGLSKMYPDIFIKAGMSRVVANILGRRSLTDAFYARCLNTIFLSQFKDDLADRDEDARANRLTPFTFPPAQAEVNPLYDLFAYDAYVVHEVFHNEPGAVAAFTYFGTVKLAFHLSSKRDSAASLRDKYETTREIDRFLHLASGLPARAVRKLNPADMRLQEVTGNVLHTRDQSTVDSRTFVTDRRDYLDGVIRQCYTQAGAAELNQIVRYSMDGSAKRLRPALTLMLAQSLGTPQKAVEPLLAAIELFHTSSLVFDDLPAQDNAMLRRGKPAAHRVFDESSVQLAAISMLSSGFGLLAKLDFPADRITKVFGYVGSVLGPERLCRGQYLDLQLGRNGLKVTAPAILEMYNLKTSTMIEAALVPLMMLLDRSQAEIALVKRYAHHAGIVFQIRDDILDATASSERTGKDTGHDAGKVNLVRVYGLNRATSLMWSNVDAALDSCAQLPFSTSLLEGVVTSFAKRAS